MADRRRALRSVAALGAVAAAVALAGCAAAPAVTPAPSASIPAVTAAPATAAPSPSEVVATDVAVTDAPASPDVTPEPSVAAAVDPCSLLTLAEARALVGGIKVPAGGPEGDPPTRCVWPTPTSGEVGQVEIDIGDGAAKTLDIDRQLGHELTAVPSLGDEAWLEPDTVFVRVGGTWTAIHLVILNDPTENDAHLLKAAALVASRL